MGSFQEPGILYGLCPGSGVFVLITSPSTAASVCWFLCGTAFLWISVDVLSILLPVGRRTTLGWLTDVNRRSKEMIRDYKNKNNISTTFNCLTVPQASRCVSVRGAASRDGCRWLRGAVCGAQRNGGHLEALTVQCYRQNTPRPRGRLTPMPLVPSTRPACPP